MQVLWVSIEWCYAIEAGFSSFMICDSSYSTELLLTNGFCVILAIFTNLFEKKRTCSACSPLRSCILDVIQNFQVPDQQSADWLFCTFLSHGNCLKCLMLLRNTRSKLLEGQPVIFHCKKKRCGGICQVKEIPFTSCTFAVNNVRQCMKKLSGWYL